MRLVSFLIIITFSLFFQYVYKRIILLPYKRNTKQNIITIKVTVPKQGTLSSSQSWESLRLKYQQYTSEMKQNSTSECPSTPVSELYPIYSGFYYTNMVMITSPERNILYHSYLECNYRNVPKPSIRNGQVYLTLVDDFSESYLPIFHNVVIVSTRHYEQNIYHFMEAANSLVHFLQIPDHPIIDFILFADNVTDIEQSSWKTGYFNSILHLFPSDHQPRLLSQSLFTLYPKVVLQNVIFLSLITPVENTFLSTIEVDLIRTEVYKHFNETFLHHSISDPVITYYNRTYRRSIINGAEIVSELMKEFLNVIPVSFDHSSFNDQVKCMIMTNVFISIHGAQMSNILFLKPSSGVIEVFNPNFTMPCYENMANMARLHYVAIRNSIIVNNTIDEYAWHPYINADVYVNVKDIRSMVLKLVEKLQF